MMKEELKEIRYSTIELMNQQKEYEINKEQFNKNFKENLDLNVLKVLYTYKNSTVEDMFKSHSDMYIAASRFYDDNNSLFENASKLRVEHPRYGEKRFKSELAKMILLDKNKKYTSTETLKDDIETYLYLEKCGFLKVKECENNREEIVKKIEETSEKVVDEASEKLDSIGQIIALNILEPFIKKEESKEKDEMDLDDLIKESSKVLSKIFEDDK